MKLDKIDKNFANSLVRTKENKELLECDYFLFGGSRLNGANGYQRIDESKCDNLSEPLKQLNKNTSGIRACFKTNSRYIMLQAEMPLFIFPMMAESSVSGFDAYIKDGDSFYHKVFLQPYEKRDNGNYICEIDLKNNNDKKIIISFPLYNSPSLVKFFIEKNATVKPFNPYKKLVCFYGSSITQGCSASRPSNSYPMLLSNKFNFDFINLGFSGNCKGDIAIAKYISNLKIDALVMEYDHNSSLDELNKNYEPFLLEILKKIQNLPIILMSRSDFHNTEDDIKRRNIIRRFYTKYKKDYANIYFVDGSKIYSKYGVDICTVDGTHPNDIGMICIAECLEKILRNILK